MRRELTLAHVIFVDMVAERILREMDEHAARYRGLGERVANVQRRARETLDLAEQTAADQREYNARWARLDGELNKQNYNVVEERIPIAAQQ